MFQSTVAPSARFTADGKGSRGLPLQGEVTEKDFIGFAVRHKNHIALRRGQAARPARDFRAAGVVGSLGER